MSTCNILTHSAHRDERPKLFFLIFFYALTRAVYYNPNKLVNWNICIKVLTINLIIIVVVWIIVIRHGFKGGGGGNLGKNT